MDMTPNERAQLNSIYSVIVGSKEDGRPGLAQRVTMLEELSDKQDLRIRRLTWIAIGIGIGVAIGGLIFGFISWKTLTEGIKLIK